MSFPLRLTPTISLNDTVFSREIYIHGGLTILLGPNGSGKTHLMRALKNDLNAFFGGMNARFISAGRIGMFETYRSDYDGYRGGTPRYHEARYGSVDDATRRHRYETLQGDFQTLAVRPDILIKIRERLRKLFSRDLIVSWDAGSLKIEFTKIDSESSTYSSAREASGLLHLAGLLAALYDDEVGILLIDEPEVSLHPQLQAFLLKEILGVAGYPAANSSKKIVIIGTHSTEFLHVNSPADIPKLIFCYNLEKAPIQVPVDAQELKGAKLASLIARMGQEHKLAFFANSPLLVEGPSDSIICGALANKFNIHLEAGGSQLLPVIGKGQFPVVVKLLRMTGKKPVILADADGIADGVELANIFLQNQDANQRATRAGSNSAIELCRTVYHSFCELVKNKWSDIEAYAVNHPYWIGRDLDENDPTKAQRRAAFSVIYSTTETELASIGQCREWETIKNRFDFLLNLLESQGCFFLRRGTIESYYEKPPQDSSFDKITISANEAASFIGAEVNVLKIRYDEVLRCLSTAAQTTPIVEAESLQDILLAISAPALARAKNGSSSASLNALAKTMVGDAAKLFNLSISNGKLCVELISKILDVPGFPLEISPDDDVVKVVGKALRLS